MGAINNFCERRYDMQAMTDLLAMTANTAPKSNSTDSSKQVGDDGKFGDMLKEKAATDEAKVTEKVEAKVPEENKELNMDAAMVLNASILLELFSKNITTTQSEGLEQPSAEMLEEAPLIQLIPAEGLNENAGTENAAMIVAANSEQGEENENKTSAISITGLEKVDEKSENTILGTVKLELAEQTGTEASLTTQVSLENIAPTSQTGGNEIISPAYLEEIKAEITSNVLDGKESFEITLNPENLGTLVIKAGYEAGKAVISIICTDKDTMQLMARNAGSIAEMIETRSGTQTDVVIERQAPDYLEQHAEGGKSNREGDNQSKKNDKDSEREAGDFLQQLRLGIV